MTESKLQAEVLKYLKAKGCYVIKTRPGVGVPLGCPDIIFLCEGFWGTIECKARPSAPYQPLQKETLERLDDWSWARRVDPTNWHDVQVELELML